MSGLPPLPDSPLTTPDQQDADPLGAALRRRASELSVLLLALAIAGSLAGRRYFEGVYASPLLVSLAAVSIGSPTAPVGVVGVYLTSAGLRQVRINAALAAARATGCATAHAWLVMHHRADPYTVATASSGLLGDGLVLGLPLTPRLRAAPLVISGTVLSLAVAPRIFAGQAILTLFLALPAVSLTQSLCLSAALVTGIPVPVAGAVGLILIMRAGLIPPVART